MRVIQTNICPQIRELWADRSLINCIEYVLTSDNPADTVCVVKPSYTKDLKGVWQPTQWLATREGDVLWVRESPSMSRSLSRFSLLAREIVIDAGRELSKVLIRASPKALAVESLRVEGVVKIPKAGGGFEVWS